MKARISLEKAGPQDFDSFFILTGNEKVMSMITERPLSKEETREKFNTLLKNNQLHHALGSFMVFEATASNFLGVAKLEITEKKRDEAELGFMLLPETWGKGYGSEIARILMEVAFTVPHLKWVYAYIDPDNQGSRKILIKNGFISEGLGELDGLPNETFRRNLRKR